MIRTISRCLLALSTLAAASALETPMILPSGTAGTAGIIDPGLGTITTVEFTESQSVRKGFANWLFDLDQLERRTQLTQNDETWSALRWGSATMKPSLEELVRLFPDKATKKQEEAGQKSTQSQVREAERLFWEKPEKYDGIVRGAYNGQELMLLVPSKRAVLFYRNSGRDSVDLIAWGTYSPLLYIQTAWKSMPDPNLLVKSLQLTEEEKKALDGALAAREDGGAAAAAKSDIWCTTAGGGFVVIDTANQKIWSYEVKGQGFEVTSARSMAVDLMAPGFQTAPLGQAAVDTLAKSYGKDLAGLGVDKLDEPYVQALVAANRVGDTAKSGSIHANAVKDVVVVNFTAQNKLLSYSYRSGAGLKLSSVRDTAVDQGLAMIVRQMNEKGMARSSYNDAVKLATKHDTAGCLRVLTFALGLDPFLHVEAEKSSSLKNELKADWDALMATATKAAEEQQQKRDAIKAAADAERERIKNRRK